MPRQLLLLALVLLASCKPAGDATRHQLVVWAWERPEDLRFLSANVEIAVQTGFVAIAGDGLLARGRRFALRTSHPPTTALVHIQIDDGNPPRWTPVLRQRVAAAVLHLARAIPAHRVQIDFEVRRSQQPILADLIGDVRKGLPGGTVLSMTALASWCQEDWLGRMPVDEVVPMLFRMGREDATVRQRIAAGRDWRDPACRHALAVSTDTPIGRIPAGRRVYLFDPNSWTQGDFRAVRQRLGDGQ